MRPVWPREDMAAMAVPYNLLEKRENNFWINSEIVFQEKYWQSKIGLGLLTVSNKIPKVPSVASGKVKDFVPVVLNQVNEVALEPLKDSFACVLLLTQRKII